LLVRGIRGRRWKWTTGSLSASREEGAVLFEELTPTVEVTNFAAPVTPSSEEDVLMGISVTLLGLLLVCLILSILLRTEY
jgi:hypothetical protein